MKPGLYEQVINEELNQALSEIPEDCQQSAPIDEEAYFDKEVNARGEHLLAVLDKNDSLIALGKKASDMLRSETSMSESSLFTGAIHEPQMFSEFKKEIATVDRIDMLVS